MRASGFLIARESLKLAEMASLRIRLILMALKTSFGMERTQTNEAGNAINISR